MEGSLQQPVLVYDRIDQNRRNTIRLFVIIALVIAALFGAIGAVFAVYAGMDPGEMWPVIGVMAGVGLALAFVISWVAYYSSSEIVLGISEAREVTREQEPQLYQVVENLCIGAGLPLPRIYVIEDTAPNAFATGRDPQHAAVAATRGLLQKLEKRELEGVMAHELSHIGNYDTRVMTVVVVMGGLAALASDFMLRWTRFGIGGRTRYKDKGGGAAGALILVVAVLIIVLTPIAATLLRLAVSRQREYLADASGALLCRNPDALADALDKIGKDTEPLETANKATAHLYISNPLQEHRSALNSLFTTHPPMEERIALLRAM